MTYNHRPGICRESIKQSRTDRSQQEESNPCLRESPRIIQLCRKLKNLYNYNNYNYNLYIYNDL